MVQAALSDPWLLSGGMLLAGTVPCVWAAARGSRLEAVASMSFAGGLVCLACVAIGVAGRRAPGELIDGLSEILLLSGVGLLLLAASGLMLVDDLSSKLRSLSAGTPGVWAVAAAAALREGPGRAAAAALALGALLHAMVPAVAYACHKLKPGTPPSHLT